MSSRTVRPSIRPSISYFDFSCQTAGPIRLKFGSKVPLLTGHGNCKARSGHVTLSRSKWPTWLIPSKIFFSRPISQNPTKFGLQHSATDVNYIAEVMPITWPQVCQNGWLGQLFWKIASIPSKTILSRPTSVNATKFGLQRQARSQISYRQDQWSYFYYLFQALSKM